MPPEPYEWAPEALTYARTTTYHWPNFNVNATEGEISRIVGEWTNSEGIGTGPFGFGSDVKLTDTSVSRVWLMAIYAFAWLVEFLKKKLLYIPLTGCLILDGV